MPKACVMPYLIQSECDTRLLLSRNHACPSEEIYDAMPFKLSIKG